MTSAGPQRPAGADGRRLLPDRQVHEARAPRRRGRARPPAARSRGSPASAGASRAGRRRRRMERCIVLVGTRPGATMSRTDRDPRVLAARRRRPRASGWSSPAPSRGLGRLLAHAFSQAGALGRARRPHRGRPQGASPPSCPGRRSCAPATSTDEAFNEAVADATVAEWGGVDVWIGNAGISPDRGRPARDRPGGLARGARGEPHRRVPRRPRRGPGHGRRRAAHLHRLGARRAARPGASPPTARRRPGSSAWPRRLALDLAPAGITVNVVAPGWFDSPLAEGWKSNPKLDGRDPRPHRAAALGRRHRPRRRLPVPRLRRLGVRHRHRPQRRRGVPARMTRDGSS